MKSGKKTILKAVVICVVAAVVIVGVGIFLSQGANSQAQMGIPVTVGAVIKGEIREEVPVKGIVEGSEKSEIQSSVTAEILEIYVEEGEKVEKGQLLALLDGSETENMYSSTLLSLNDAKRKYESSEMLYREGAIAESEYLDAKATYDKLALELQNYNIAEKTNITSPISGTVTRVNVTVGSNSNSSYSNEPMFIVEDLENLKLNVDISEYDIRKIENGQTVDISAEMLGNETVYGEVAKIAPSGEKKADSAEMIIPVEISIDNSENKLLAGVTAKADILVAENKEAIMVPVEALMVDPADELNYVFVEKEGILSKIQVDLGIESIFDVEVVSSKLAEGDSVILNPTFDMTDGMAVFIADELMQ